MVYIGMPSNPQFLRDPAERDPQAVAQVISVSRGQSGRNTEYLYLLEKALEGLGLGTADGHVTDLVRRVREISRFDAELGLDEERAEKEAKREMVVDIALELAETTFTAAD
jgi:glutathione-specific gamma-glutamylcyclotransferase